MTDYTQTASQLRQLVTFLQGLAFAADNLDKLGSIDNAINEAQRDLKAANDARDAAIAEVDAEKAKLPDVQTQAQDILEAANHAASGHLQAAEDQAAGIVATATGQAKDIIAQATNDAETQQKALLTRNAYLQDEIAERQKLAADAAAELAALTDQLQATQDKLDAANAAVAKLLGGGQA